MKRAALLVLSLAVGGAYAQADAPPEEASGAPPGETTTEPAAPAAAAQPDEAVVADSEEPGELEDASENDSVTYSGIGLSRVTSDFDNLDDAVNLDAVLGLRVPTINWISAELGISATVIPGENKGTGGLGGGGGGVPCIIDDPPTPPGCTPAGGGGGGGSGNTTSDGDELAINVLSVAGVLRSPGRFYVTGKGGYRYIQSSISELDEDRSGAFYGAGLGWRWGKSLSGVELVYTKLSDELDHLALSLSYGFGAKDKDNDDDDKDDDRD